MGIGLAQLRMAPKYDLKAKLKVKQRSDRSVQLVSEVGCEVGKGQGKGPHGRGDSVKLTMELSPREGSTVDVVRPSGSSSVVVDFEGDNDNIQVKVGLSATDAFVEITIE